MRGNGVEKRYQCPAGMPGISANSVCGYQSIRPAEKTIHPRSSCCNIVWSVCVLSLAAAIAAPAQTFTTLVNFDGSDGSSPYASVVQGTNGDLYGTTYAGGTNGSGEVLQMGSSGVLTPLYSFCSRKSCGDGAAPAAGVVLGTDENLYGTTSESGAYLSGTLFKITPGGTLTSLHDFCSPPHCTDGAYPHGALLLSGDGNFYGITSAGGRFAGGTVFSITPSGTLTVLYAFCSQSGCSDGTDPQAGLALGTDGLFYGTTYSGGTGTDCTNGCGTVFSLTPQGVLTTLHSFCTASQCADGYGPLAALVEGTDGNFYGATGRGGAHGQGTIFKITSGGTLTTLYTFCSQSNCTDGSGPRAGLVMATDGAFYGTTYSGGAYANGALFRITTGGKFSVLHSFDVYDGQNPSAGLVQDTNGTFYGTTAFGGSSRAGTAFSLGMGLSAFIEPVPIAGEAGRTVIVLGTNLSGASSVTFNGKAASFTVESDTAIKTTVPSGASTGPVQVVTPSGTLTSNVSFRIAN